MTKIKNIKNRRTLKLSSNLDRWLFKTDISWNRVDEAGVLWLENRNVWASFYSMSNIDSYYPNHVYGAIHKFDSHMWTITPCRLHDKLLITLDCNVSVYIIANRFKLQRYNSIAKTPVILSITIGFISTKYKGNILPMRFGELEAFWDLNRWTN